MTLIEQRAIWQNTSHNAFTDLIRFQDRWYCTFREAETHVSSDGRIRVLVSDDGNDWEVQSPLVSPRSDLPDLRDSKLSITPDNRLMLISAAARHDHAPVTHQTLAWFSADGEEWSEPVEIGEPNFWMWRVTWHQGTAYSTAYATAGFKIESGIDREILRLYKSRDGVSFEPVVPELLTQNRPNESTLVFDGDRMFCLTRHEAGPALIGQSLPPYTDWEWQELGVAFGGPDFLQLPDGSFLAGGRLYDPPRMSLCRLDVEQGKLEEIECLPSGGDCSYPGLVWHEGRLWVSYYSSHEGHSSIYLAKLEV